VQLQDLFDGYASVGIAPSVWQKTSRRGKSLHDLWSKSYPYVETITLSRPGGTALSRLPDRHHRHGAQPRRLPGRRRGRSRPLVGARDREVEESLHMIHDFRNVKDVSALTDPVHTGSVEEGEIPDADRVIEP
jgi:hypothetical protein